MSRDELLSIHAIQHASEEACLDAARNGLTGARQRLRKPLRLPPQTWEKIQELTDALKSYFPNRYITVNSTLEFLVNKGLHDLTDEEVVAA